MKSQFDEFFVYAVIRHMAREINTKGAFQKSELAGQTMAEAVIFTIKQAFSKSFCWKTISFVHSI